ncbi:MAG: hypothetical protein MR291_01875 [Oscillospiraceae bacterium]|nr:hypothetical protein [Oscillospiraceae bacterium]
MKKIFASMMAAAMVVSLAGCNGNGNSGEGGSDAAAAHKLGMGVCTSIGSSKAGTAQVDATVAAVVLDADGKIVSCKVDVAQNKMDITDGAVPEDASSMTFKSKKEKLEEYNMKPASAIGKEWYEQAEAFEAFVVGKTADEVAAIPVETTDNGHVVTTDETLKAGCTMSIDDLIDATVKACKDDSAADFTGDAKLALTCSTSVDSATASAADGEDGTAAMYTTFAAVAVASDGKLAAVCYDEVQPKVTFDAAGEITSDTSAEIKTKREKKEEYNMKGASSIGKEWYEQNDAFETFVTGKTSSEISAISTETTDNGHVVTTDETLKAGCTMSVDGMINTVVKAMGLVG